MCSFVVLTHELRPAGGPVQTDIDPRNLIGRKALDRNGSKIGTIDEVYLDDATGVPEWAAIRTGLFSRDAFVPLEPSELVDGTLRVPFERALIKDSPDFGVGRHLSPEQELQLYHHYGLDITAPAPPQDVTFGHVAGAEEDPT
ncbi:PRC-barrel domain containing protein [Streptomyces sp. SID14478]|nr:PRC-barrel domain-containing protein [Streptomyces sp. SID14478]NEB77558.1 PRC-barrel domain containing protein [Streptomyces sp. SID14478]